MLHNFSLFFLLPVAVGILLPPSCIPLAPFSSGLPPPCPLHVRGLSRQAIGFHGSKKII